MQAMEAFDAMPLVAILRGLEPSDAEAIGDALFDAGFRVIEVPLNSPYPLDSIQRLARRFSGRALVGAGTVRTPQDVEMVRGAGGGLIVTPHAAVPVIAAAKRLGMVAVPGCATPTEAFACLDAGADALKLFPAEAFGPAILRAYLAVLPKGTAVLPVGGIAADGMAPWWQAGAAGFGIGSALFAPGRAAADVAARALSFVHAMESLRQTH